MIQLHYVILPVLHGSQYPLVNSSSTVAQIAIMAKKWKKRSADTTPVDEQQVSFCPLISRYSQYHEGGLKENQMFKKLSCMTIPKFCKQPNRIVCTCFWNNCMKLDCIHFNVQHTPGYISWRI